MMEQNLDPPPIFWAPDFTYIQIKTMIFQKKNYLIVRENGKCWKETK